MKTAHRYVVVMMTTMMMVIINEGDVDDTENEIRRHVGLVNEEKLLEFLKG